MVMWSGSIANPTDGFVRLRRGCHSAFVEQGCMALHCGLGRRLLSRGLHACTFAVVKCEGIMCPDRVYCCVSVGTAVHLYDVCFHVVPLGSFESIPSGFDADHNWCRMLCLFVPLGEDCRGGGDDDEAAVADDSM